jgi:hypothetical protein
MRQALLILRSHAPWLLLVATVALVTWPLGLNLNPGLDADGAWEIALRQALHDGLDYGPDVLFTYGPLGSLHVPLFVYPWSARIAFAWWVLIHLVLVATLLCALTLGLRSRMLAVLLTIPLTVSLGGAPDLAVNVVLTFIGAVALTAVLARGRRAPALAFGLGVLAGVTALDKLNTGVTVVALGLIGIAAAPSPRRRLALPYATAFVVAAALGWILTGQSFGAIPGYLHGALGIISGYSEAMMAGLGDPRLPATLSAVALASVVGLIVAWRAGEALPARARAGFVLLWAVLAFTAFKAAFVRHGGNSALFFATLLGGLVAFSWAARRRQTVLLVGAFFALAVWTTGGSAPTSQYALVDHARNLTDLARLLADGSETNAAIAAAREQRWAFEQIDPRLTDAVGSGTVHVYPYDAGVVWARGLRWRPLPVFQAYSAYTEDLDGRNADMVRSRSGPDFILLERTTPFDGRNPAWESPAAMAAMLCRFRPAAGPYGRWLLLRRGPALCGRERPLSTTRARLGERVAIPSAPDDSSIVLVRIDGVQVSGLEKLRTTLYRARVRWATFDGSRGQRLIPATAEDGLLLRVPPSADYPPGFHLDQRSETLAVSILGRSSGELRYRFSSMAVR